MPESGKRLTGFNFYSILPSDVWVFLIWLLLTGVAVSFRPLLPIDETRYAAVAWEMWTRNDFLVPHLNGELYSHKPPLLFWLINLVWKIFGVNDWGFRLIAPAFALATAYLSAGNSRLMWPEDQRIGDRVPLLLFGSWFWIFYATVTMFDMLLAFFVAVGIRAILTAAYGKNGIATWLLFGVAVGGGVLTKGPVVVLHLLPLVLSAPWWLRHDANLKIGRWYGGFTFGILVGAAIALCWALPAGMAGGDTYRQAIFFGQTQGRLVSSFAHKLPWWWYFELLPVVFLPWILFTSFWRGLRTLSWQDAGIRFCTAWGLPVFVAFSLISGKRAHYLIPMLPLIAILLAKVLSSIDGAEPVRRQALCRFLGVAIVIGGLLAVAPWLGGLFPEERGLQSLSPWWGLLLLFAASVLWIDKHLTLQEVILKCCIASVVMLLVVSSAFFSIRADYYNMQPVGAKISEFAENGKEVAYLADVYHGEFQFGGRLTRPLTTFRSAKALRPWVLEHPGAYVLIRLSDWSAFPELQDYFHHPYKSLTVVLMPIDPLLANIRLRKSVAY